MINLSDLPNFCGHEHWGSITSIGATGDGFRSDTEPGALPQRPTRLADLILEPYLGDAIAATGIQQRLSQPDDPVKVMRELKPVLGAFRLNGAYACTRLGIERCYDVDIAKAAPDVLMVLDEKIAKNYASPFDWYREVMATARFEGLIRPVSPGFYLADANSEEARQELAFTKTVMRIDPLVEWCDASKGAAAELVRAVGVDPKDKASWRVFLDRVFELAAKNGCVGIKQLQAYRRSLDFAVDDEAEIRVAADLGGDERTLLENWIVNECCKRAHDRGWPHQIHVGTHNLPASNPLPLEWLARRYPKQKIVMLHGWPFIDECAFLAKRFANVYIDSCWLTVLGPTLFEQAMQAWLTYVPTSKLMCSHDSTTIEMAVGSSLLVRQILGELLAGLGQRVDADGQQQVDIAMGLLFRNAAEVYGASVG